MVEEGTNYTAASYVPSQSTAGTWKVIRELWMQTYSGPPDFLVVDQGSAYTSEEMRKNSEASGIRMKEAPIESPGTLGVV